MIPSLTILSFNSKVENIIIHRCYLMKYLSVGLNVLNTQASGTKENNVVWPEWECVFANALTLTLYNQRTEILSKPLEEMLLQIT